MERFVIHIPDAMLEDLHGRLAATRWRLKDMGAFYLQMRDAIEKVARKHNP